MQFTSIYWQWWTWSSWRPLRSAIQVYTSQKVLFPSKSLLQSAVTKSEQVYAVQVYVCASVCVCVQQLMMPIEPLTDCQESSWVDQNIQGPAACFFLFRFKYKTCFSSWCCNYFTNRWLLNVWINVVGSNVLVCDKNVVSGGLTLFWGLATWD